MFVNNDFFDILKNDDESMNNDDLYDVLKNEDELVISKFFAKYDLITLIRKRNHEKLNKNLDQEEKFVNKQFDNSDFDE